ncbi:MAG TPA: RNA polymerase sigma factor [Gemmataceae bacterium]|jgi:RNA polymerase sigma factor (sigma-70 family)|nr:RNA polymerase sigma factor [Gemmataceae bacterium]
MTTTPLEGMLPCLRRMFAAKGNDNVADAELVRRFAQQRDEAAFELLVWRHGRMVLHVCRRILGHEQEAEDAFQATFLTLARRAGAIRKQASVPSWLHTVASRIAFAARARGGRRKTREHALDQPLQGNAPDPATLAAWQELGEILHAEVDRLGELYRLPFILCCLEGKTNAEAARELRCPVGTIESRLVRARERLRARLTRRGITLSAGLLAVALDGPVRATFVSPALIGRTARAALLFAGGGNSAALISAQVLSMTEGILRTMLLSKVKPLALAALVLVMAGVTAGLFGRSALASGTPQAKPPAVAGSAAHAKDAAAQAGKQFVQSGTLKKIDLKEGTVLLQVQTQMANATFFTSPYVSNIQTWWTDRVNPNLASLNSAGKYTLIPQQTASGHWIMGQPYWAALNNSNAPIAANEMVWFPSVNGTLEIAFHDVRRQLGPLVEVVIDGKAGKLTELPANIWVTVTGDKDGRVTRIQADGSTMDNCIVDSLDPVKHTLAFGQQEQRYQYELAPQVEVKVNGRKSTLADLRPDMPVWLRFSAVKQAIIDIRANGPTVECLLKGLDAERGRLTVSLKKEHLTIPNLTVAADAQIMIDGHGARLIDLKSRLGKPISIRMDADPEANRVLGIFCNPGKK